MTSLFALTYPYLSGYQHIGASLGSGVDISGYTNGFAGQSHAANSLGNWNQFGSLVGSQAVHDKSSLALAYGNTNVSPISANNQVTSTVAREGITYKTRKYTAKGTRSCPYNMSTLLNDEVSAIVRRRNERERDRVRCVNTHYEHLKRHLPNAKNDKEKRISKLEVLRSAIDYIKTLQSALEQSNNNNPEEADKAKTSRVSCSNENGDVEPLLLDSEAAREKDKSIKSESSL